MSNESKITLRIEKLDQGLGLILPDVFVSKLELKQGSIVDLIIQDQTLSIRPHLTESLNINKLMQDYDPVLHNYPDLLEG